MKTTSNDYRGHARLQQFVHRLGVRNLIIFTPLLIATVFSLGFMQIRVNYTQQQVARSRQQADQRLRTDASSNVPLIARPAAPIMVNVYRQQHQRRNLRQVMKILNS